MNAHHQLVSPHPRPADGISFGFEALSIRTIEALDLERFLVSNHGRVVSVVRCITSRRERLQRDLIESTASERAQIHTWMLRAPRACKSRRSATLSENGAGVTPSPWVRTVVHGACGRHGPCRSKGAASPGRSG
jgi:hypothetical protein